MVAEKLVMYFYESPRGKIRVFPKEEAQVRKQALPYDQARYSVGKKKLRISFITIYFDFSNQNLCETQVQWTVPLKCY